MPDYSSNLEDDQHTNPREFDLITNYRSGSPLERSPGRSNDDPVVNINDCNTLSRRVLDKYDQMEDWKNLHEALQVSCLDFVLMRIDIKRFINQRRYKLVISRRETWALYSENMLQALQVNNINTYQVRNIVGSFPYAQDIRNEINSINQLYLQTSSDAIQMREVNILIERLDNLEELSNNFLYLVDEELKRVMMDIKDQILDIHGKLRRLSAS